VTKWTGTLRGQGIEYAESEAEADELLLAEADRIDFSRDWLTGEQWASVRRIALNPKFGLKEAYKSLFEEKDAIRRAAARLVREQLVNGVLANVVGAAKSVGDDVRKIIEDAARRYVEGGEVKYSSPTGARSTEGFEELCDEWETLAGRLAAQNVFTNLRWMPIEDKQEKGKGNVGDTLDTREKQGCILLRVGGVKFNAHVDITD
jgi:hypothetical protein